MLSESNFELSDYYFLHSVSYYHFVQLVSYYVTSDYYSVRSNYM